MERNASTSETDTIQQSVTSKAEEYSEAERKLEEHIAKKPNFIQRIMLKRLLNQMRKVIEEMRKTDEWTEKQKEKCITAIKPYEELDLEIINEETGKVYTKEDINLLTRNEALEILEKITLEAEKIA